MVKGGADIRCFRLKRRTKRKFTGNQHSKKHKQTEVETVVASDTEASETVVASDTDIDMELPGPSHRPKVTVSESKLDGKLPKLHHDDGRQEEKK